jgi:membrane protein
MPNTHVRFRAAIIGAAVVSVLWLVARWGFAVYVQNFVIKGSLYGLLGVLPLFLLWLYYSWLIFLFGAELAHTAVHLGEIEAAEDASRRKVGPLDLLAAALTVARRFIAGGGATGLDEVARTLKTPSHIAAELLEQLATAGLLCRVEGAAAPRYIPAGPVGQLEVMRVLEAGQFGAVSMQTCEPSVAAAVAQVHERIATALSSLTLDDALRVEP